MNDTVALSIPLATLLLVLLSIVWLAIGFYFARRNKTFEDHALAGRSVGLALGAATAVATWITSNTIMLAPQLSLQMGIWGMLAYSTASFGLFLFAPLAKRIRVLMPSAYTAGDFMRLRYGEHAWYVYLIITVFYSLIWLVTMVMAGGILLESLSNIPYSVGMTVILAVCVIYTINGGLSAVIGTDFVQSVIILLGVIIVGVTLLNKVSVDQMYNHMHSFSPKLLDVFFPAALMAFFNNLLFGLGEVFHNNVWWSRAFAMREGVGAKAFFLGGLIWLPVPIAAGFIAYGAGVLNVAIPTADMVGPLVSVSILGDWGAVLIFIVVFCSLASSIDSLLASISDLITEDIYRGIFLKNRSNKEFNLKKASQYITLVIGLVVWGLCLPRWGTLMTVLFFAGPLVGSLIWPIIAGLFWRSTGPYTVLIAMLSGSVIGLSAYFLIGWYVATLIATLVSMLCVLVGSYLYPNNFDWIHLSGSHSDNQASKGHI